MFDHVVGQIMRLVERQIHEVSEKGDTVRVSTAAPVGYVYLANQN
jgi:hypothetical protein